MAASITYTYLPAFVHYGANVKIVHFLGSPVKPWDHRYDAANNEVTLHPAADAITSSFTIDFLKLWWRIFTKQIAPLVTSVSGTEAAVGDQVAAPFIAPEGPAYQGGQWSGPTEVTTSQAAWEAGHVDYTGRDRFENIMKHIDSQIAAAPVAPVAATSTATTAAAAKSSGGSSAEKPSTK